MRLYRKTARGSACVVLAVPLLATAQPTRTFPAEGTIVVSRDLDLTHVADLLRAAIAGTSQRVFAVADSATGERRLTIVAESEWASAALDADTIYVQVSVRYGGTACETRALVGHPKPTCVPSKNCDVRFTPARVAITVRVPLVSDSAETGHIAAMRASGCSLIERRAAADSAVGARYAEEVVRAMNSDAAKRAVRVALARDLPRRGNARLSADSNVVAELVAVSHGRYEFRQNRSRELLYLRYRLTSIAAGQRISGQDQDSAWNLPQFSYRVSPSELATAWSAQLASKASQQQVPAPQLSLSLVTTANDSVAALVRSPDSSYALLIPLRWEEQGRKGERFNVWEGAAYLARSARLYPLTFLSDASRDKFWSPSPTTSRFWSSYYSVGKDLGLSGAISQQLAILGDIAAASIVQGLLGTGFTVVQSDLAMKATGFGWSGTDMLVHASPWSKTPSIVP